MYEHRCLENIKKLYKSSVKYDDQHKSKAILELAMVSTPEMSTDNSMMSPDHYVIIKNPNTIISLCLFTEVWDVKK